MRDSLAEVVETHSPEDRQLLKANEVDELLTLRGFLADQLSGELRRNLSAGHAALAFAIAARTMSIS